MSLTATARYKGVANIEVVQSAATAANTVVWSLRNTSSSIKVVLMRLYLEAYFKGTAVATVMGYEILKATGVTAYGSAPTVVTPSNKITSLAANLTAEARVLDTGFTLTGATFAARIRKLEHGRVPPSATQPLVKATLLYDFPSIRLGETELAYQECLVIRTINACVISDVLTGSLEFEERAA